MPNAHASDAVNETRRSEQKVDSEPKGTRWTLLKDRSRLTPAQRTARAWQYREPLREILDAAADQSGDRHALAMMHERDAPDDRADEGRGADDPAALRGNR